MHEVVEAGAPLWYVLGRATCGRAICNEGVVSLNTGRYSASGNRKLLWSTLSYILKLLRLYRGCDLNDFYPLLNLFDTS